MPGLPLSPPKREEIAAALTEEWSAGWAEIGRRTGRHSTTIIQEASANGGRDR